MKKTSQTAKILNILRKGRFLTPVQCKAYGIVKPSARITELRNSGVAIQSTVNKSGNFAWVLDIGSAQ